MGGCGSKGSTNTTPGAHGNKPGIESEIVEKPKPLPSDDARLINVTKVDLNIATNTADHKTDEYDITDFTIQPNIFLVIRRGQKFIISIEFNREYDQSKDELRLVFQFGKRSLSSRGTHAEFMLSDRDVPKKWGAHIVSKDSNSIKVEVLTPPTCPVGKWRMSIDVVKRDDTGTDVFRYKHKDHIYVLFNPWCEADQVYMIDKNGHLLNEYILNETGKIYSGNYHRISPKPWVFGQFTGIVLDCIMYLLENSSLDDTDRGNPVLVCRELSAMINSSDKSGVLSGNWSGDYSGGASPLSWAGSIAIFEQYYETKRAVKYGQCWVFSGLLTTACRAIGIPARSVTNFASAHDTNASVTIDTFFDPQGEKVNHLNHDSVWNFHVWNDVWMARPDLPPGYGGVYRMGPTSLTAVKRGDVALPYDGKFVFAEVNADRVYWLVENEVKTVTKIKESAVGKRISTKKPASNESPDWLAYLRGGDPDREDVSEQYKYKEGSAEERAAVRNATTTTSNYLVSNTKTDVTFELEYNADTFIGDTIKVSLKMTNTSTETRTINGTFTLASMYYTGAIFKVIEKNKMNSLKLQSKEDKVIEIEVAVEEYLSKLTDHCMCKMSGICLVKETHQVFSELEELRLRKPHLDLKAPSECVVGEKYEVEASFVNPLPVTLTKCELRVEGPRLQKPIVVKQKDVGGKDKFTGSFELVPKKKGESDITVYFNCALIEAVTSSHKMTIKSNQ
ncbi:hypothetical protein ACF0H5_006735 [Mactra antiquata]